MAQYHTEKVLGAGAGRGSNGRPRGRVRGGIRLSALLLVSSAAIAAEDTPPQAAYSPAAGETFPRQVYWGDTHLHTRNSPDAYSLGNMNLSARDAYAFARGEEVTTPNGLQVRLRRPLDFLVVSDHAEYLGAFLGMRLRDPRVLDSEVGRRWSELMPQAAPSDAATIMGEFTGSINEPSPQRRLPDGAALSIWQDVVAVADEHYLPGRFTTFSGYEWTSMIDGNNLHRVVVFADDAEQAGAVRPFSAQDSTDPEDLWAALAEYEAETGGDVIAIPHNGNVSNGMMFAPETVDGEPIDRAYAETRQRWEPLYEVTQVKGDAEAHPSLSPNDAFADYETWDTGNISMTADKQPEMLRYEYARPALKVGLAEAEQLGVNPFKFGMIGSTDSHTALATAAEDNFFGKFSRSGPSPGRTEQKVAGSLWANWRLAASGLAAVWAPENTREALFAAMKRREVYATTGPRIQVRFFGGWGYPGDVHTRADYVRAAYRGGVPMGGDLNRAPTGQAPRFVVVAAKDPDGANLDRVQIVKGWLEGNGELREQVYDVALSDGREVDPESGEVAAVGSTVDVQEATYTNTIGDAELAVTWEDPDFDASERAFYYARVIEIPKPRWTAYDAAFYGIDLPEDVPMTTQDRAYTSPIWYTP